ncbi:MAG: carboxylating nicotinate-nucleotide diphosphorylase [Candidatus Omnitrophota bacterium]|jgi:nicotinate-nucleotide pyrophosphorylase (carboxylating)
MMELDKKRIDMIVRYALKEDIWTGDITSQSVLNEDLVVDAVILAREQGVICGMQVVERVFETVDPELKFKPMVKDGDHIEPGQEVAFVEGPARSVLKAERTALNFLGLMSGVSTETRKFVDRIGGAKAKLYDTRKTIPLHRYFQKYAVTVGGGTNHRKGLWDMVLIKDNHIRALSVQKKTSDSESVIKDIIKQARSSVQKNIGVEIEVESLKECGWALDEKPDVIMLDNMPSDAVEKAVALRKEKGLEGKILFEVSGGVSLENIAEYARTGVEIISTGKITSSARTLDFSLEIILKGT